MREREGVREREKERWEVSLIGSYGGPLWSP